MFFFFFFFQAEDGIRDRDGWLEFRRVLFRSAIAFGLYAVHISQGVKGLMGYNYLISNMRCKGCEQDFYQQFKSTLNSGRYIESLLFISYFLLARDVLRSGHKPQSAFQIFWNCKIQRMLYYMLSNISSIQNLLANVVR